MFSGRRYASACFYSDGKAVIRDAMYIGVCVDV